MPCTEKGDVEDNEETNTEDSSVLYKTVNEELPTDSEGTVTPDGSRDGFISQVYLS